MLRLQARSANVTSAASRRDQCSKSTRRADNPPRRMKNRSALKNDARGSLRPPSVVALDPSRGIYIAEKLHGSAAIDAGSPHPLERMSTTPQPSRGPRAPFILGELPLQFRRRIPRAPINSPSKSVGDQQPDQRDRDFHIAEHVHLPLWMYEQENAASRHKEAIRIAARSHKDHIIERLISRPRGKSGHASEDPDVSARSASSVPARRQRTPRRRR